MLKNPVQVVNFASFLDGADKKTIANAILKSFQETGFVYLINHGFPQPEIDTMFNWTASVVGISSHPPQSKKFFSLPLDEKMLAPHPPSGVHHRGS
ncbi:hypothetical protein C0993_001914 [Termitomyces sp. T159_Od127]|nr:hypothetical protein C0993_001914 [Termitomyces sp. T159_Od127]